MFGRILILHIPCVVTLTPFLYNESFAYLSLCIKPSIFGVLGTNLASKFLRANGITLFKVRDEIVKVLGEVNMFARIPERPPMTDDAQRALDWAVDRKLKSGLFLPFFSFTLLFIFIFIFILSIAKEWNASYKNYMTVWINALNSL